MNSEKLSPYFFLIPALAFFSVFLAFPIAFNVYVSFFKWKGLGQPTDFIGVGNYAFFLQDPDALRSIQNTLIWVAGMVSAPVVLGLLIAVLVDARVKGEVLFKSIFFLPYTISAVATGVLWEWMYYPSYGALNTILRGLGLEFLARPWLASPPTNTLAMMAALGWSQVGFSMVIFLAGLRSISPELVEASKVDGLSSWQTFRHVAFPLLTPFTTVVVAMSLLNTLKVFDIIFVMTGGGPYFSSETLAVTMYRVTFQTFGFGYGSAVANVLFLIVVVVTVLFIRAMFRQEIRY